MSDFSSDISNYVAKYAKENGISASQVKKKMADTDSIFAYDSGLRDSVFDVSDTLDQNDFSDQMKSVFGIKGSTADKEIEFLFDVFDEDNDGKLSSDELAIFSEDGETYSGFDLYTNIAGFDESNYNSASDSLADISGTDEADDAEGDSDSTVDAASSSESSTETSSTDETDDEADADAATGEDADTSVSGSIDLSSTDGVKSLLNSWISGDLKTYNDVFKFFKDNKMYSDEEISEMKDLLSQGSYSQQDEAKIQNLVNSGKTREEAIELLKSKNMIKELSTGVDLDADMSRYGSGASNITLDDAGTTAVANQLRAAISGWGTDEDGFEAAWKKMETPDDYVAVAKEYLANQYSLEQDINGDFSGSEYTDYINDYAKNLLEAAKNGNNDAIGVIAQELWNSMEGMGTRETFISAILDSDTIKNDPSMLKAIDQAYSTINGRNLLDDLQGDFSGEKDTRYTNLLLEASTKGGDISWYTAG